MTKPTKFVLLKQLEWKYLNLAPDSREGLRALMNPTNMRGAMRKLFLLATAAVAVLGTSNAGRAADMPVKAMPPPLPPPFSWTGFYLGGNIGGAWAERRVDDPFRGVSFSRSSDAVFMGGGQLGFNYQINTVVLGVEWDFDAVGNNDNRVGSGIPILGVPFAVSRSGDRWLSTLAARLGYANDHWLFYAKLGVGEVGTRNLTITNLNTGVSISGGNLHSRTGAMLGFGLEYAFTNNWTVKAEYDFIDLSSRSFVVPLGARFLVGDVFTSHSNDVQTFKVGFNYLFGRAGY
jgi:outer membrane immunogenic protein